MRTMWSRSSWAAVPALCVACVGDAVSGPVEYVLVEDFEAGLSDWVGRGGGAHQGTVVEDPLRPGNQVLTFTGLGTAGDVFSREISTEGNGRFELSFEYLGRAGDLGVPGDLGGTIGFSEELPGRHRWIIGTVFCCGIEDDGLVDDGRWRSYSVTFDVFAVGLPGQVDDFASSPPVGGTIRLVLEDFAGSGGEAGDVYFDHVRVSAIGN